MTNKKIQAFFSWQLIKTVLALRVVEAPPFDICPKPDESSPHPHTTFREYYSPSYAKASIIDLFICSSKAKIMYAFPISSR
jgi:hypothetical protein